MVKRAMRNTARLMGEAVAVKKSRTNFGARCRRTSGPISMSIPAAISASSYFSFTTTSRPSQTIQTRAQVISSQVVFVQVLVKKAAAVAAHLFASFVVFQVVTAHIDQVRQVRLRISHVHAIDKRRVQRRARRWANDASADRQIID